MILCKLNLEISRGERVAMVGINGSGKTTVFRILARQLEPTRGKVFWAKGLRVCYLPQQPVMNTDETVRQVAMKPFDESMRMEHAMRHLSAEMASATGIRLGELMAEYARLEGQHAVAGGFGWEYRIEEVLAGVGLGMTDRDKPSRLLSGGEQGRLALAGALLSDADLLVLDEPANHLDLEAVQWLEKYLTRSPAAVLLVSHDRYLLDRVATKVYELLDGCTESYPGNYTDYVGQREIRQLNWQRQFEQDQAYIDKQRDFIARFHASGSRSREARGRKTRLERQLKAGEFITRAPQDQRRLKLRISSTGRISSSGMRMTGVSKSFGSQRIIDNLTLEVPAGQKLAILGPNGVGKTTLLRIILGEEPADAGTITLGHGQTIGYYDQKQSALDDSLTVLQQMKKLAGSANDGQLRGFLAPFLFTGEDVFKPVATLSGGERSRLLLAKLFYDRPNLLVLDEPT
ncbi:MAG: ABC-F family ATP-binding cassette domain-containing protein, partial [Planctomycetes bacterium]|nr:ABC-F family ATP-binding cassette domain-containing protein [Planctomycetota bacterium]